MDQWEEKAGVKSAPGRGPVCPKTLTLTGSSAVSGRITLSTLFVSAGRVGHDGGQKNKCRQVTAVLKRFYDVLICLE